MSRYFNPRHRVFGRINTPYNNSSNSIATETCSVHYDLVIVRSPGFGSNLWYLPTYVVAFAECFHLHHKLTR
jgi:hypothetical protein